jgi:hypothetical protein
MQMRFAAAIVLAAGLCAPAFGQFVWSSAPSHPGSGHGGSTRANEYMLDDGVAENSVGLTGGGDITWGNRFTSMAGFETITAISVAFGTGATLNGQSITVGVWSDPNGDGNPSDAVLLSSAPGVISGAAASPPAANVFVTYNVPNVTIPAGQNFFLGVMMTSASGEFPAAIDQTTPQGRSWVAFGGGQGWAGTIGEIGSFGLPGNWLIRGDAIPAPSSLALLGLGGLVAARRRRA